LQVTVSSLNCLKVVDLDHEDVFFQILCTQNALFGNKLKLVNIQDIYWIWVFWHFLPSKALANECSTTRIHVGAIILSHRGSATLLLLGVSLCNLQSHELQVRSGAVWRQAVSVKISIILFKRLSQTQSRVMFVKTQGYRNTYT